MPIMLPVPGRFLVATLCGLSLYATVQADSAPPQPSPAAQQAACERGDNAACNALAHRYDEGDGVVKDAARALAFRRRACDQGDGSMCWLVGYAYEKGEDGLPKDKARAAKLYQKGCDLGDTEACCSVYTSCGRGEGECKDPAKAEAARQRSIETGGPDDRYMMCWAVGWAEARKLQPAPVTPQAARQTPPAVEPSVAALQGECERGSAKACYSLAKKYGTGEGVPKDEATSARLYEQACRGKFLFGCSVLGSLYASGQGVPASIERAMAIWRSACDAGEPNSCTLLGAMYELRRVPKDPATAAVYYQKGCDGGHAAGCTQLSKLYRKGLGVPQDAARADELWQLGCKRDSAVCEQDQPAAGSSRATAAAKPASANCVVAGVQLGVDTVASVERDIQARGGSPLTGGSGPAKYRVSTMTGDYQDAGTNVAAVNYDFDAAGPAGRLTAVTIVNHAYAVPEYEAMLASRKAAAAAIAGPLQQKSATELVASSPGCQLRLLPNAGTWFIHEVYQLPN